jgi:hypothetical protein
LVGQIAMTNQQLTNMVKAVEEFDRLAERTDGQKVVASLDAGLTVLRDLIYGRIHSDVERVVGADSMLIPLSEIKAHRETKLQIDVLQVAESVFAVTEYGYLGSDTGWYLDWLAKLRLGKGDVGGELTRQVAAYVQMTRDGRRLAGMDALAKVLPESRKAPLILFRLVPLAVHIATALSFGDQTTAAEIRSRQISLLPAITDCPECRGAVLESEEICKVCNSPMWKYEWLTVAD